jgi:hypothetical protein
MKDPSKHYIIADPRAADEYVMKGYEFSKGDVRDHLPPNLDVGAGDLVLLEIDKATHEALQKPPTRYSFGPSHEYLIIGACVSQLDVLQQDDGSPYYYVGKGDGATRVHEDEMFSTPREVAIAYEHTIRKAISTHRQAIVALEDFLKRYECL